MSMSFRTISGQWGVAGSSASIEDGELVGQVAAKFANSAKRASCGSEVAGEMRGI